MPRDLLKPGKQRAARVLIQVRKRELENTTAAALDVRGINAVVTVCPGALGQSPTEWGSAIHEMFHVWHDENGSRAKIMRRAAIGPANDVPGRSISRFPTG